MRRRFHSFSILSRSALFVAALGAAGISAAAENKVSVAIIDSGVDNEHPVLAPHMWMNPKEIPSNSQDDDRNAYIDDVYGWNFAEQNASIIDRTYLGKFSQVPYRFFELQEKQLLGTITAEELEWMKSTVANPDNLKELQKFGNFVHGTHVSGIVVSQAEAAQIMALKIIPTEVKLPFQ